MRSHLCGNLNIKNLNEEVTICGWIHRRRDHGGVIFLDVRDATGIVQVVVNPENKEAFKIAEDIRSEYVIKAFGQVEGRPEDSQNDQLTTGDIEIKCSSIELLNEAFPVPVASKSVSTFINSISSVIDGEPAINSNTALHTAAIYSTDFAGTVTIEGS